MHSSCLKSQSISSLVLRLCLIGLGVSTFRITKIRKLKMRTHTFANFPLMDQKPQTKARTREEKAAEVKRQRNQREAVVLERRRQEEEEQARKRLAGIQLQEETKQRLAAEAERKKEEENNESDVAVSAAIQEGRLQLREFLQSKEADPVLFPAAYLKECTQNFSEDKYLGIGGFGAVFLAIMTILSNKSL